MSDVMEEESLNQRNIRLKLKKNTWWNFLGFVLMIGVIQSLSEKDAPPLLYLATYGVYFVFLYHAKMSKKTNWELWQLWEVRWSERKRLFQCMTALTTAFMGVIPILFNQSLWWITFIFIIFGMGKGFWDGGKEWEAKKYYYEEYIELYGRAWLR